MFNNLSLFFPFCSLSFPLKGIRAILRLFKSYFKVILRLFELFFFEELHKAPYGSIRPYKALIRLLTSPYKAM